MILAGRGCMGTCAYCAAPLWRNIYRKQGSIVAKHRRRSNDNIIAEALQMKKHGAQSILFMDDYFIRPYEEMLDFFQTWTEQVALPMFIHLSVDQLRKHPDLLKRAFDAGLTQLDLALQSGDEEFCLRIFNRHNDNKAVLKFFYEAYENFIPIFSEFIDGYLIDEYDDLQSKINFIRQLPPFDPAFRYANAISVMQLRVHPGSPLFEKYPNPDSLMLPSEEFIYRAMLMHFRLLMSDEEFERFRIKTGPRKNPEKLLSLFHMLLAGRHNAYIAAKAAALEGKDVFFFGCGEVYRARKQQFAGAKPRAILVDRQVPELIVDGLEVMQLQEILPKSERIPIVIFSAYALSIAQKIKKLRPDYSRADIIACETVA